MSESSSGLVDRRCDEGIVASSRESGESAQQAGDVRRVESTVGARIRSLREDAGMTQGELAARVFVSRQTVINWEKDKTLPDVESVKLLSAVFGISLDALLDDRSEEYLEQTARQRRTIVLALALNAALLVEVLIGLIVTTLAYEFLPWNQAYPISRVENLVRFAVLIPASVFAMKMGRIKREHELSNMLEIAAFLEGYRPGAKLPQTFIWRCLLPHWSLFIGLTWGFVVAATLIPLLVVRMAS